MISRFRAKCKWRAENITAGETRQRNLNERAEGLINIFPSHAMLCHHDNGNSFVK
jgi:hypothetical protein